MAPRVWHMLVCALAEPSDILRVAHEGLRMHPNSSELWSACAEVFRKEGRAEEAAVYSLRAQVAAAAYRESMRQPPSGDAAPSTHHTGHGACCHTHQTPVPAASPVVLHRPGSSPGDASGTAASAVDVSAWGSGEVEGWIGGVLSDGGPLQALCQSIVSGLREMEGFRSDARAHTRQSLQSCRRTPQRRRPRHRRWQHSRCLLCRLSLCCRSRCRRRQTVRRRHQRLRCPRSHSGADEIGD
jgi:hypothetical protein